MADSTSLPQASLDKPTPYSVPESGDQEDFAFTKRQQPELRVKEESAPEDPPLSVRLAQRMTEFAQTVGNLSVAELFAFLFMVVKGIHTILWEVPTENIREREEIKEKVKEIRDIHKKIGHYSGKLEEKIRKAHETDNFKISKVGSDEWEWLFIETKYLIAKCGFGITYLQGLVSRLDSEARFAVRWITFQLITGLLVVFGMMYYYWGNVKETGENETAAPSVTVGSVLILGMAIILSRKVREFSKSNKLVGECKEVKSELDRTKLNYMNCKQAVESKMREQKKMLYVVSVVDYDESLCRCKKVQ